MRKPPGTLLAVVVVIVLRRLDWAPGSVPAAIAGQRLAQPVGRNACRRGDRRGRECAVLLLGDRHQDELFEKLPEDERERLPPPLFPVMSLMRDISVSLTVLNVCAALSAFSLISSAIWVSRSKSVPFVSSDRNSPTSCSRSVGDLLYFLERCHVDSLSIVFESERFPPAHFVNLPSYNKLPRGPRSRLRSSSESSNSAFSSSIRSASRMNVSPRRSTCSSSSDP